MHDPEGSEDPRDHAAGTPDNGSPEPPPPGRRRFRFRRRGRGHGNATGAFAHRGFTIFWLGAIVSNTGGWLSNLAVPFVLYQITGSALWVGLATVAQFVPNMLLGPLGGSLADRVDRRTMLLITQCGMAVTAFALWILWVSGAHDPVILLIPIAFQGVFQGLNGPSWQAFVNDLVPRADLRSAVTLNSLQFNMARSFGPAIAGVLLAAFGPGPAFLINALSFAFVLVSLLLVRPLQPQRPITVDGGIMRQFVRATRYMGEQPGILVAFIITLSIGLFSNPLFSLTVVFAEDVYRVDAVGLGLLNAALGLGAIIVAPVLSTLANTLPLARIITWGMIVHGLGLIALGFVPGGQFWLSLVVLVIVGGAFIAVSSSSVAALQFIVADHMRGRVMAVRLVFFMGSIPVGTMIQTSITEWLGVEAAVIFAGVCMLLSLFILQLTPGRARLERLDDPHDDQAPGD